MFDLSPEPDHWLDEALQETNSELEEMLPDSSAVNELWERSRMQLTQEELGKLVGVQRAQISKLESSANSATIDTILKVFSALKAEINFNVKIENNYIRLA